MALAYGGHAMIGLGFLNLLGTLLFFGFLVFAFKMFFRGMKVSRANGGPGPWNWQGPSHSHNPREDEAMKVAKERLAQSEISPEEYETVKRGLRASTPQQEGYRQDSALATARMRFAQGELSQEEFDAVMKALLD